MSIRAGDRYVYLYRDPEDNSIRYVGKGTRSRVDEVVRDVFQTADPEQRAAKLARADKREVRRWFAQLNRKGRAPIVEIMPCRDEEESLAVEASLISALWDSGTLLNKVHGHHREFGPLGVPENLSRRRYEPRLCRHDLANRGVIAVHIGARSFYEGDPRYGSAPRLPLNDDAEAGLRLQTYLRICRWWQVGKHVERWRENPATAPVAVIGVTGPPQRRWVWGSLKINPRSIPRERSLEGLCQLAPEPSTVSERDLDAYRLRGRLLAPDAVGPIVKPNGARHFGGIRPHFFDVIERSS